MIQLTPSAVSAAKTIVATAKEPARGLRILVEAGGCSGFMYKLELAPEQRDGDAVVEADGVQIFIDDLSQPMVAGMVVDYASSLEHSGFVFQNPNATASCGCGKSFA
ncbi:Iron-sulfur cluster assembly accessory protein [Rhodoblastus acidophilus]|uniref:Iron-sulfur cluster assembly accessory protein n=1 Tax=Rhodoblastus acidophilus TaxID=1074 RepID=A0A212RPB3_RHOAC|nr:iron-sulfur cluster assembly accessory protein [Rhodoblastus acidophilus]MCW2316121.1 iron-sulfur cluster assembly accessory protein [Rhodoblastus acidophilus]PPQ36726.1 iron-sulfur cluster assembly accessory protein [Rhodoblastus acidophilus]RAI21477.1 iron-sulfur cluster assembly accessory protein [Rhodoblastus acidophilus]SNB74377.1 Iron-sulfur cluster assembly accessory protein [Rhodoblastus acidophilus]